MRKASRASGTTLKKIKSSNISESLKQNVWRYLRSFKHLGLKKKFSALHYAMIRKSLLSLSPISSKSKMKEWVWEIRLFGGKQLVLLKK